jgi:hypothetical protein
MSSSLRWKLVIAFLLVFLAGAASGFFGGLHRAHWMFARHRAGSLAEHLKQHLRAELQLSPQQVDEISPIVNRASSQLEAKREQTAREVRTIFEQMHNGIAPLLTPEQRRRLEEMEQRHRRLMHRHGFVPPPPPP